MTCPACKKDLGVDYGRPGCSACGADLAGAAADAADPGDTLVEVFRTPDIALLMVVKSALGSAGIPFQVQGKGGLRVFPLSMSGGFFNSGAFGALILVLPRDFEDVKKLIEDGERNEGDSDQEGSDESA